MTIGNELNGSDAINSDVLALVKSLTKINSQITGVRDASSDLKESYAGHLNKVHELRGRPLFYPYVGSGAGRGPYVELADGSVKLDLINGIGIHILGHGHPKIVEASLRGALQDSVMQGNLQPNFEYIEASEKLTGLAKKGSRFEVFLVCPFGFDGKRERVEDGATKKQPSP